MLNRFYLSLLLISGMLLGAFLLFVGYREMSPEWKQYQVEYKNNLIKNAKDDATRERANEIGIEIRQIYLGDLKRVDRCTTCHLGVENPLMADAEVPFKKHSGDYLKDHPQDKFGCTTCHHGQGRALSKKEAHGLGHETHWDDPIIPTKYIQSSCAQCHDYKTLEQKGVDVVVKGRNLFQEKGCRGCHKLNKVGGDLGKPLDGIGSQPIAYFPMKHITGERTAYSWIKQHFDDPRKVVAASQMRAFVTDEEADLLTTYILTLKAEEPPREYRRFMNMPEVKTDGESLYKKYCIACHATGKISVYDEILKRTIPAIMNPAFLKVADNKFLKKVIKEGRTGTQMTAWKISAAGLSDHEIDKIIEYVSKDRPEEKPEKFGFADFTGDGKHGGKLYEIRCVFCHGSDGKGGKEILGIDLTNPIVQSADPEFLAITVRDGRAGTPMASFGKKGLGLKDQDIVDLVTYLKTLSKKKESL